jgi:prolyl-tRNA synthetase
LNNAIKKTEDKKEMIKFLKEKKIVKVPLCNSSEVEEKLKEETGAKVLFIYPEKISNQKCIISGKKAEYWVCIGKTY